MYKRPLTEDIHAMSKMHSQIMGARQVNILQSNLRGFSSLQSKRRAAQGSADEEPERQRWA